MRRAAALVLLLAGACLLARASARRQLLAPADTAGPEFFIEVRDGNFMEGCRPFRVAGWNQWEVLEAASGAPSLSGASIPTNLTGPEMVRVVLDRGVASGLNTVRIWAHAVNPQYALQTAPGQYNEAALRGLDYVLSEAQKRGLKVILAFTTNWTPTGGVPEYLRWAGKKDPVDFYTDPAVKKIYRDHVEFLVNRVNSINGRKYSEDPTIMAWNLGNELRCKDCPKGTIAAWADEMATFLKSVDPNHLVTIGEDGFYGCCMNPANPGVAKEWPSDWAAQEGQDFIADHASKAIDFATFHAWVDNWGDVSEEFLTRWIEGHVRDARRVLRKPVVLEEFGKWLNESAKSTMADRDRFFKVAYKVADPLIKSGDLQGSLFWQWYLQGQVAPASEGGGRGLFGIYDSDSTFDAIRANAKLVNAINSAPMPGCSEAVHKAAPVSSTPECVQHRVADLAGTGKEGLECDIPINECVRGTDDCDANAACIDSEPGFQCKGYEGDGRKCRPNSKALKELESVYWSEPEGLGCVPGFDVAWPTDGPGFVYDPLDSFSFWNTTGGGKFGSRRNVTLAQCMQACQMSDTCESVGYNDVLMQCFLKRAQCPLYNMCWDKEVICYSDNDRGGKFAFGCGFWRTYYRKDMDLKSACADYKDPFGREPVLANAAPFEAFVAKYGLKDAARHNPAAEPETVAAAAGRK